MKKKTYHVVETAAGMDDFEFARWDERIAADPNSLRVSLFPGLVADLQMCCPRHAGELVLGMLNDLPEMLPDGSSVRFELDDGTRTVPVYFYRDGGVVYCGSRGDFEAHGLRDLVDACDRQPLEWSKKRRKGKKKRKKK